MSMGHTQKKQFTDKKINQNHMVVTSLVEHNLPVSHPETSRIYLTPSPLWLGMPFMDGSKRNNNKSVLIWITL